MSTDAIVFNLQDGGLKNVARMDRGRDNEGVDPAEGFGSQESNKQSTRTSFKETYNRIAGSNRDAKDAADSRTASRNQKSSVGDQKNCDNRLESSGRETSESDTDKQCVSVNDSDCKNEESTDKNDKKKHEDAEKIISDALIDLAQMLNLSTASDLDKLSLENLDDGTKEQLSEILYSLKKISEVLDMAAAGNQSFEIGGLVVDPQKASEMSSTVKTELFRIEIGMNMLGVSEDVQSKLSVKLDQPFSGGIPQAKDPSELSMPVEQIRTAFGNVVNGSENEITELAQKVMQLVKENASGKPYSITFDNASPAQDKNSDPGQFDTKTLRAILKIDGVNEKTAIENSEAANSNEKLNIPESVNQLLAKNPAESALAGTEHLPVADIGKAGVVQNMPMFEAKTITGQTKSFEESESVMNQITQKLNTAVRSGINEVKIQLRPESLGEVNLKIRIEGDVVMARIQVESQQVKQIVESNMQHLKDALAQQNLQAGSLEVNVGSGNGGQADQTQYQFAAGHENHSSGESKKADSDVPEETTSQISGEETGRRFGNNSVEYFA